MEVEEVIDADNESLQCRVLWIFTDLAQLLTCDKLVWEFNRFCIG